MPILTLENILSALEGVRQTGPGRWSARCPAHDDRSPSLSIREVEGGRVLLHCFSGCLYPDVIRAIRERLGLQSCPSEPRRSPQTIKAPTPRPEPLPDHNVALAALFEEFQEAFPGSPAEEYLKSRGIVFDNLTCPFPGYAAPGKWPGRPWKGGRIVFPHHIPNMDKGFPGTCNLYGRAIPVNGQDAPKELRHDHLPGPKGIYNAWALKKPQVILTEGVFDALSFSMSGYQAIAVFGTSGFRSIWPILPYTPIVIIGADNDEAGQKAAVEAWRGLALGKAVYVERPPKDCKDWNEAFMKHGMIHLPIYRPPKRYTLLRPYPDHYEAWEVAREEDVLEPGEDGRWRDKQGRVMSFDDLFGRPKRIRGKDAESLGLDNEPLGRLIARDGIVETWECGY